MTRIVLCTPPWSYGLLAAASGTRRRRWDHGGVSGQGILPQLGLHHLATTLEQDGHTVHVVEGYGRSRAELVEQIAAYNPDVIGLSVVTALWEEARALLPLLAQRLPKARRILGGPHPTLRGARLLDAAPEVDALFIGPAEESLRRWLANPGTKRVVHSVTGAPHADDWGQRLAARVSWDGYQPNLMFLSHPRFAHTVTSLGCTRSCAFCAVPSAAAEDARTPQDILGEWTYLAKNKGVRVLNVMDDDPVFVRPGREAEALLHRLIDARLDMKFTFYLGRFDVDDARLALLRRAGCSRILVMAETAVPRLLEYVKGQKITPEEIAGQIERIDRAGIQACARFQFGFAGETFADGLQTIRFARKLPLTLASFMPALLFPGSRMAEELERSGRLSGDERRWSHYGRPFEPDAMTAAEQSRLCLLGMLAFYGQPRGALGLLKVGRWRALARRVLLEGAT